MDEATQIKIVRSLFPGRVDAYGHEKIDGYFECVREALTDELIGQHLNGGDRVGIYPVDDHGDVQWGAIDIDEVDEFKKPNTRKAKENAIKVYTALVEKKLAPYLENSKSKGFHTWLFFDEAIPAKIVRKVLKRILKDLGLNYEVFPKQDQLTSNNGVGNFVFLPLNGKLVKAGRNLFLDSNLEPYPDQWEYLSKAHRTKVETVLDLAEKLFRDDTRNETEGETDSGVSVDLDAYLKHYSIEFLKKKEGSRTLYKLRRCPFDAEHTTPDREWQPAIIQGHNGKISYFCFHVHCANKRWADIRAVISGNDSLAQFCEGYSQISSDFKQPPVDRGLPKDLFQIIDEPETQEIPLVENLLFPGDKGFIVSMYKMGKTLFLIQMALCLSMAVPFLGLHVPKARRVLYLRFELKDTRFRKRLAVMLPALGGRERVQITPYFHMTRGFDIKSEKDFSWLLGLIYKFEPDVLLLDPFYKLSMSSNLKEPESAQPIIRRFDNLMGRFPDLHVSIAHHLRKQTGGVKDDSWDSAYGPMQLFADMDYEIRISRKAHFKDTFIFSHISNDLPIDDFTFTRNSLSLLYELETTEDIRNRWAKDANQAVSQVRSGLNTKGNLKTWIELNLKYSQRDTKDFLDYLLDEKRLLWMGNKTRGKFAVPDDQAVQLGDQNAGNDLFQSLQSSD